MSPKDLLDNLRLRGTLTPIGARFFAGVMFAASFLSSATAAAQEPTRPAEGTAVVLTEEQAVSQALERPALVESWDAQGASDEAAAVTEGAWPNPGISYSREQLFEDSETVTENVVVVEQTLPLSGRRGLLEKAAKTRAQATKLQTRADARQILSLIHI